MEIFIRLSNISVAILYVGLVYLYGLYFFRVHPLSKAYMSRVLKITMVVHLLEVAGRGWCFQYFPVANIAEAATVLALALTMIYIYIESYIKVKSTGFFILGVSGILQVFSSIFITFGKPFPLIFESPMFIFHTSTAILGDAALFISALYGLMYLMLFYDLKSAQFGVIYRRMPSLEELNEMNVRSAVVGFLFLTVTILLGVLWRKDAFPDSVHFDPKIIAVYLIWLIYGGVIYGKKIGRWPGKRLAYISLSGFVVLLVSILAFTLFVDTFHQFG